MSNQPVVLTGDRRATERRHGRVSCDAMNGVLDSDGQNLMVSWSGSRGKEGKFASSSPLPRHARGCVFSLRAGTTVFVRIRTAGNRHDARMTTKNQSLAKAERKCRAGFGIFPHGSDSCY